MNSISTKDMMVYNLYENLNNVFRDEESKFSYNIKTEEMNEDYFIALLRAFMTHFCQLTKNNDMDLLDFIAILNKLAYQYLMDECSE